MSRRIEYFIAAAVLIVLGVAGWWWIERTRWEAGESARQVRCLSNMRQIGLGLIMYADAHGGQYPDLLATLARTQDYALEVFVCPSSRDRPARATSAEQLAAALANSSGLSYVYIGARLTRDAADSETVVMYEPLTNHRQLGGNVLFGDARVEWWPAERLRWLAEQER